MKNEAVLQAEQAIAEAFHANAPAHVLRDAQAAREEALGNTTQAAKFRTEAQALRAQD